MTSLKPDEIAADLKAVLSNATEDFITEWHLGDLDPDVPWTPTEAETTEAALGHILTHAGDRVRRSYNIIEYGIPAPGGITTVRITVEVTP